MPDAKPLLHSSELGRVTVSLEAVAQIVGHTAAECKDVRRSA